MAKNKIKVKSQRNLLLFFVVKFFIIFAVLNYLIEIASLAPLTEFIAKTSAGWLSLPVFASTIISGGQLFVVTNLCTGLVSASILAAIIFSLRRPSIEKKILLFLAGAAVLLVANIPRVVLVLFAAQNGFDAELVHEFTWIIMSVIVLGFWYYGTKRIEKIKEFNELL